MSEEIAEIQDADFSVVGSSALVAITKGEVATQIDIAKRYPRSLKKFKTDAETIACNDLATAESMWYEVPRDGKTITGPSVRLAEIVASAWGNLRFGSRLIDVSEKSITAQGYAHDLETNVAVSVEVDVGITKRDGRRYSDTMVLSSGRSAQSIALRNAIFRVIPKALVNQILAKARDCAKGSIKSIEVSRVAIGDYFKKLGIDGKRVAGVVGRAAIDDLSVEDIVTLRAIARGIQEGEQTLEDAFPRAEVKMPTATTEVKPEEAPKPEAAKVETETKKGKKEKAKAEDMAGGLKQPTKPVEIVIPDDKSPDDPDMSDWSGQDPKKDAARK